MTPANTSAMEPEELVARCDASEHELANLSAELAAVLGGAVPRPSAHLTALRATNELLQRELAGDEHAASTRHSPIALTHLHTHLVCVAFVCI
jgi:hypothetical protein